MSDIDLEKAAPGGMYTRADNAKEYTFYLVADKPNFTAAAFEANPNVATGADLIWKSPLTEDGGGRAMLDLAEHAKAIKDKLKEARTPAKAVVVAKARDYTKDPNQRSAIVKAVTLHKKAQEIKLKPIVGTCGPQDWVTYHHSMLFVEMTVKGGIPQVQFEVDPKTAWFASPILVCGVWENDVPGSVACKRMILGAVGDNCNNNAKCKCRSGAHNGNWYPLWATQFNNAFRPINVTLNPAQETYIFGLYPRHPGQFVLTVKGTGPFASIVEKATLSMTGKHPNPGD